MKPKHLCLAIATLLAAGGLWLARSAWRTHALHQSSMGVGSQTLPDPDFAPDGTASLPNASTARQAPGSTNLPDPGQMLQRPARLAPPVPNRRFTDFTPEQRVQFARQGHGPGG